MDCYEAGADGGALTWNLFHGRDFPPDPDLRRWRHRLLPGEWRRGEWAQVNRSLREEFAAKLADLDWQVALLQEVPPRWIDSLAQAAGAESAAVLTSRNWLAPARAAIAGWNPDLIASNEGGSNQLLVRPPWHIEEARHQVIARRPERRTMIWARLVAAEGRELCVTNLHATAAGDHSRAAREVLAAAELSISWAPDTPLILGGDLNLRPPEQPWAFDELGERFGLTSPTSNDAVDHLLARDLEVIAPPRRLPDEQRDVARPGGGRVRLSDHALVAARFALP
jgi:endonuclease/exonuclease/phosphatase family metal-dependent hydrolase